MLCQQPLYASHRWRVPVGSPQPASVGLPVLEAEQPEPPGLRADSSVCQHPAASGFALGGQELGMKQSRNAAEPPAAGPLGEPCFIAG